VFRGDERRPGGPSGRPGRSVNRRSDRGAAAVEAAFVFPVMILLVFGIIDFGRMLNAQLNVTEAASQGVRVAAFGGDPTSRVAQIAGADAAIEDLTICAVPADLEEDAQVTVTYRFEFATPVGALIGLLDDEIDLTGRGAMPCR
jgi:Flp pilus assembly protein TadG